jgi:hypothetical protein
MYPVALRMLDREGNLSAGVRVEATPKNGGMPRLFVINRAGIYYLLRSANGHLSTAGQRQPRPT